MRVADFGLAQWLRSMGRGNKQMPSPSEYAILERANEAGYLPRQQPQRAFTDDYRKPVEGVVGSRLGVDIDGRPIADSAMVAGRRTVQGDDVALGGAEFETALGGITNGVSAVPRADLPRSAVGAYNETRNTIKIADDLPPDQRAIATTHEFGHAIDKWRGTTDVKGHEKALRKIYHDGRTGQFDEVRPGKWVGPEVDGYKGAKVPEELWAEAYRAYIQNPNAIKSMHPKLAAELRERVNSDPFLSKSLHLNSFAGAAAGAGAASAVGMAPDTAAAQTPAMAQMLRSGGTVEPQRMMAGQWDMLARKRQAGVPLTPDEEQAERGGHAYKAQVGDPAARDAATTVGGMALPLKVAALELLAPSPAGAQSAGIARPGTNDELQAEAAAGEAQRAASPSLAQMLRSMFGTVGK